MTYKKYKISFEFTTVDGLENMEGILNLLKNLGDIGATRCIGIMEEEGWPIFLFDGDGADKIDNIKIEELIKK